MPTTTGASISADLIREVAFELNRRAAIHIPDDVRENIRGMAERETEKLSKFVLLEIVNNYEVADEDQRPMCADTGLPRFYAKIGNEAQLDGGFVAFEKSIREATARATKEIPLRPNRVHPITRHDYNNNVGIHAPDVAPVRRVVVGYVDRVDVLGQGRPREAQIQAHVRREVERGVEEREESERASLE